MLQESGNIMHIDALRALYDREQRIEVEYPDTTREVTPTVIRHLLVGGRQHGWILWSKLDTDTIEATITAEIAYFDGLGRSFEWKVYDYDQPADLRDRLAARGFILREPADAIMVLDLHAMPDMLQQPIPAAIRPIKTPDGIRGVMGMLQAVWGEDYTFLGDELINQLENTPDALSMYAAFDGEAIVSGAWIQYTGKSQFAGLWGGSTLESHRRRGLYTGLLAVRANEARERGIRFLTVDASPMSRPILEKFGFRCIGLATACEWGVDAPTA
jgi:GNAT superfamily N-acetyltransferase